MHHCAVGVFREWVAVGLLQAGDRHMEDISAVCEAFLVGVFRLEMHSGKCGGGKFKSGIKLM